MSTPPPPRLRSTLDFLPRFADISPFLSSQFHPPFAGLSFYFRFQLPVLVTLLPPSPSTTVYFPVPPFPLLSLTSRVPAVLARDSFFLIRDFSSASPARFSFPITFPCYLSATHLVFSSPLLDLTFHNLLSGREIGREFETRVLRDSSCSIRDRSSFSAPLETFFISNYFTEPSTTYSILLVSAFHAVHFPPFSSQRLPPPSARAFSSFFTGSLVRSARSFFTSLSGYQPLLRSSISLSPCQSTVTYKFIALINLKYGIGYAQSLWTLMRPRRIRLTRCEELFFCVLALENLF